MLPSPFRRSSNPGASPGMQPLEQFRRQFDNLFEQMFGSGEQSPLRYWDFAVEDHESEIVVRAEVPGFEPEELDVQIQDNVLTIKAEHREQAGDKEQVRSFQRSATLPANVNQDQASAEYRNGVLRLALPKAARPKSRNIPIGGTSGSHTMHGLVQPPTTGRTASDVPFSYDSGQDEPPTVS